MGIGGVGGDAAARRAVQEAFLQQKRLNHVFERGDFLI